MTSPINATAPGVRTVGSNYTTFQYAGKSIAYLEVVADQGQNAFGGASGAGYEFIHPLGYAYPTDIVTSRVLEAGQMQLTVRELWHQEIWQQFPGLTGARSITDIFRILAASPQYVTCTKIITPPSGRKYGKVYHKCVIIAIQDGEQIDVGALSVPKTMTIAYTNTTPLA